MATQIRIQKSITNNFSRRHDLIAFKCSATQSYLITWHLIAVRAGNRSFDYFNIFVYMWTVKYLHLYIFTFLFAKIVTAVKPCTLRSMVKRSKFQRKKNLLTKLLLIYRKLTVGQLETLIAIFLP